MSDSPSLIKYSPGQLIVHKKYGYRGVIIEVDDCFQGTEEQYHGANTTDPPRDKPWYHILVDGSDYVTYVPEMQIEVDPSLEPINHPKITEIFHDFRDGKYFRPLH
ncbi:MAG: heat shock protein HspQ [Bdellovibrionales bacterium]|nr:heat shock protein HspQ [Bdellovibrionales bacterium]